MANIRHYLNGNQINEPRNWQNVEITLNFRDTKEVSINVTSLNFVGNSALIMRTLASDGICEGAEYRIEFGNVNNPVFVFNGNLDFTDDFTEVGTNEVIVTLKKQQGRDWITDRADAFSFASLYDKGIIVDSDFVQVPYVINYVPDNMQLLTLSISIFVLTKESIEVVRSIAYSGSQLINSLTPNSPPFVSLDLGDIIELAINTTINIAYAISIGIAIVKLTVEIVEQLLPTKRYHLGMRLSRLMELGSDYLGLQFSSQQIASYGELVIIPTKGYKGGNPPDYEVEVGFPNINDSVYTFGDLLRVWMEILNSDIKIKNGILEFERRDFWKSQSGYYLPSIYNDQENLVFTKKFNTNEIVANYNINFAYDTQDLNTLDFQDRRIYQKTIELSNTLNKKLNNLKGLKEVQIPYSLAVVKTELTEVEVVVRSLLRISDTLTGRNDSARLSDRIGSMHLSSHFITVPKIVIMDGDNLAFFQRELFNAKLLWDNEHYINSVVPINGEHNQYLLYENTRLPFNDLDFQKVEENNYFTTIGGKKGEIDTLVWLPEQNIATIDYRINEEYIKGIQWTI